MNLIDLVGWSLVHSLWEGALLALALFAVLHLVNPKRAVVRYLASIISVLLLAVLPPFTAWQTARFDIPSPSANWAPSQANHDPGRDGISLGSHLNADGNESPAKTMNPSLEAAEVERSVVVNPGGGLTSQAIPRLQAAFPWLVAFWALGVVVLSLRLLSAWLRARQLRIDGTSDAGVPLERALARVVAKLGVLRPVRILQTSILQVPAVIGWLRPVVLIPATLASGLTIGQLEAILAHELAHIRRHDYLVNLLQALVETLLFYHPAAWWISRQARQEREHCCDDVAIRACGDRTLYAGALLTLEEHRALALMPSATGGDLVARVRRIAALRLGHADTSPRWLAGVIAVVSVVTSAAAVAYLPPTSELSAQDVAGRATFADRNAGVAPDTVIRHPDPSAPLAARWQWASQLAADQRYPAFWVGYTIEPMPGIDGSIYIGRLERAGITGSGGLNLRGRITNFGRFDGLRVPGVMLAPLIGGGMPDDVALLFAFVLDNSGRPMLARVHISSLALPVDLEDRPLLWLGDSDDAPSITLVRSLFDQAPRDLKPDVVAALGVHGSSAAIPHLARWLEGSESSDVREEAAEWLGRHPDPSALALLARTARNDRVSDVRREAAEAVAEMALPAATDSLIVLANELRDSDARQEAVEGLAEKSDPRALAAAVAIARNDPNTDVRREAVETLGEFKDAAGVPHLIELARRDRNRDVRMEAVETLAEAADPDQAIPLLRQIIEEDPDEDVAREAVETLGELEHPQVPRILRELAQRHPRRAVRVEAIETLAEAAPGSETVKVLSQIAREDQDGDVQEEALESLSEMGDPEARKLVAEVARSHASAEVRRRAVEQLVETLDPEEAVKQLKLIAINDRSVEVQVEATESLAELPAAIALPALRELASEHPVPEVRVEAVESLGELGTPEALEIVARIAESRGPTDLRREAVETIGEQGDHQAALTILSRIVRTEENPEVASEAVETIAEQVGEAGVDVLADVARNHPSSEVRMEALESLAEMGSPRAINILMEAATRDESPDVQEEAVESLGELPNGAGVDALLRVARDHPNREMRVKALSALGESDDPRARGAIDRMLRE